MTEMTQYGAFEARRRLLEESSKISHENEILGDHVLNSLAKQKEQLQGAYSDVRAITESTDDTGIALIELQNQQRKKQLNLYLIIVILGVINILLIYRIFTNQGRIL